MRTLVALLLSLFVVQSADAQPKVKKKAKPIIVSNPRTYRLEVGKIDADILLNLERRWTFKKAIPASLLTAIRKHPKKKQLKESTGTTSKRKPKVETGYIRWSPDKKSPNKAGALLWYRNGQKRKEVVIGLDVVVGAKSRKGEAKASFKFEDLRIVANLEKGQLIDVGFNDAGLPKESDGVKITETMEANVSGELSAQSSKTINAANELLSDELQQKFRAAAFSNLKNESHHGITLGWLGHESLGHNLMLIPGGPKKNHAFRYRVAGGPFPLMLIRRQIGKTGWPMMLSGHEYLGSTESGRGIFRRVEYQLARPAAKAKQSR